MDSAVSSDVGSSGDPSASAESDPKPRSPRFRDAAKELGVDFTFFTDAVPDRFFLPEVMGGGIAWIDYDLDGSLDLYLANGCPLKTLGDGQVDHISRLYRQHRGASGSGGADTASDDVAAEGRRAGGHRFADATSASRCWHNGYGQGCAVGDYDADGFPDIFLANFGADVLLHNLGDGTFETAAHSADVSNVDWSSSAVWHDIDADGDLDLYVCNYMDVNFANYRICYYDRAPGYCGPGEYNGVTDSVYLNRGDGRFEESAASLGMDVEGGKSLAVSVADLDGDRVCEVYVANDMENKFLFATSGSWNGKRYGEVAVRSGCAASGEGVNEASMGIAIADYNRDGLQDIILTNFYHAKNTLYQNLGDLTFADESYRSRIAVNSHDSLGFGVVSLDWDRDGAPDLLIANGHVLGPNIDPWRMRQQSLWNDGRGRFYDTSGEAGPYFSEMILARSLAAADFDNDGDCDAAVSHLDRPTAILVNETDAGGHFLGLELRTPERVPPLGGQVKVEVAGRSPLTMTIQAGGSYLAAADSRLLCGWLEDVTEVTVVVTWPGGAEERFENLAADRYWILYPGRPPRLASP